MINNISRTVTKTFYYNAYEQVWKLSNKQSFDYRFNCFLFDTIPRMLKASCSQIIKTHPQDVA